MKSILVKTTNIKEDPQVGDLVVCISNSDNKALFLITSIINDKSRFNGVIIIGNSVWPIGTYLTGLQTKDVHLFHGEIKLVQ